MVGKVRDRRLAAAQGAVWILGVGDAADLRALGIVDQQGAVQALADAGALAYRFESVDLADLLRQALQSQQSAFTQAGLTLESELPESAPVRGDGGRLAQLWANLAANSCRYTDRGGRVRVSLRQSDGHWRLCWEDSAPGVSAEALQLMFDPLYRVDASRSRAAGGAGLGLAIARRIVDAHGASIHAESSALGGVAIHILWPQS